MGGAPGRAHRIAWSRIRPDAPAKLDPCRRAAYSEITTDGQEVKPVLRGLHRSVLLHRLRHHIGDGGPPPDRVYSTFSIPHAVGAGLLAAALCLLLRRSETFIPPLVWKWVDLFEIREIFAVELLSEAALGRAYRVLTLVLGVLVALRLLAYLAGLVLGGLVLLPDRLIAAEWGLFAARIHHVPYSRVLRLSTEETMLHRVLGVGNLRVFTSGAREQVCIGPLPGFPALLARLVALLEAT